MTHHRQGSVQPGDKGDLVRGYEFAGDRLVLRPAGTNAGSDMGTDLTSRSAHDSGYEAPPWTS